MNGDLLPAHSLVWCVYLLDNTGRHNEYFSGVSPDLTSPIFALFFWGGGGGGGGGREGVVSDNLFLVF